MCGATCFLQDQTKQGKAFLVVGRVVPILRLSHLVLNCRFFFSFSISFPNLSEYWFDKIHTQVPIWNNLPKVLYVLALPPPNFISSLHPNVEPKKTNNGNEKRKKKKEKRKRAIVPQHHRNSFDIIDYIISIIYRPSVQRITPSSLPRAPGSAFSVVGAPPPSPLGERAHHKPLAKKHTQYSTQKRISGNFNPSMNSRVSTALLP